MDNLRKKAMFGSMWMTIERFGYLTCQFLSNIVLARLLSPTDFGTVGILMVFILLSNVLIDSGLSTALIQKATINETDKSTVFFTNLALSFFVYIVLFLGAPYIADYFTNSDLVNMLRVVGVIIIIDAFCAIQNTLLTREIDFKTITLIKIISIFIAALVAIILAYYGFGVWSLIIQYILYSIIRTTTTWIVAKWRPKMLFSIHSLKTLFDYGSKLLLSSFIAEFYVNLQQIIIGRHYQPADLGFYSQARQLQNIPTNTVTQVINYVSFPIYSRLQCETSNLLHMFRQNIKLVAFFNIPLMVLLSTIAHPLFIFLYSEKWIGSVDYFRFLCLTFGLLLAIHQCTLSVLKALGHSDYVLQLEIIKKILGIIFIMIGMYVWGIWGILYALGVNSVIELFLNGYYLQRELGYGGFGILKDILAPLIISFSAGVITFLVQMSLLGNMCNIIIILLSTFLFITIYFLLAWRGKLYGFLVLKELFTNYFIHLFVHK